MIGKLWQRTIRPLLFRLDAERAHELGIEAMKLGFGGTQFPESFPEFGEIERFGLKFVNPLGIAAGFDKNGVVVNRLASLGFGFVEVGTVTFRPQSGNPKPRLFRLPDDRALINRLGFNNDGAAAVAKRLEKLDRKCIVGVNIGKNKDVPNEEATENYLRCLNIVHPVADYIAVNISSPNTPALRDLQMAENLEGLLKALTAQNDRLGSKPLLVKIAPDLSENEIEAIVNGCIDQGVDGIIATNTTVSRERLRSGDIDSIGAGGLSGRPVRDRSTEVVATVYKYSQGRLPIVGVGGIFSAEDAFAKIAAGASLVQAYTGFVYGGPGFAREISRGLAEIVRAKGFNSLDEAVGSAGRG